VDGIEVRVLFHITYPFLPLSSSREGRDVESISYISAFTPTSLLTSLKKKMNERYEKELTPTPQSRKTILTSLRLLQRVRLSNLHAQLISHLREWGEGEWYERLEGRISWMTLASRLR
jgi:hypothetical protein